MAAVAPVDELGLAAVKAVHGFDDLQALQPLLELRLVLAGRPRCAGGTNKPREWDQASEMRQSVRLHACEPLAPLAKNALDFARIRPHGRPRLVAAGRWLGLDGGFDLVDDDGHVLSSG